MRELKAIPEEKADIANWVLKDAWERCGVEDFRADPELDKLSYGNALPRLNLQDLSAIVDGLIAEKAKRKAKPGT